ncbi:MAG: hypothetical protein ACLSV7_11045 [Oscillospiraceae bacterium]
MGKWKMLILFLALTVVLWGCAGPEESRMDEALAFRAALVGAGGCSFMGEITADYGDEVHTFSAACTDDTGPSFPTRQRPLPGSPVRSGLTGES